MTLDIEVRGVWLTRAQRDWLAGMNFAANDEHRSQIVAAWDSAPSDAVDAVCSAIANAIYPTASFVQCETAGVAVLDELNHPSPDPDPEEPPDV